VVKLTLSVLCLLRFRGGVVLHYFLYGLSEVELALVEQQIVHLVLDSELAQVLLHGHYIYFLRLTQFGGLGALRGHGLYALGGVSFHHLGLEYLVEELVGQLLVGVLLHVLVVHEADYAFLVLQQAVDIVDVRVQDLRFHRIASHCVDRRLSRGVHRLRVAWVQDGVQAVVFSENLALAENDAFYFFADLELPELAGHVIRLDVLSVLDGYLAQSLVRESVSLRVQELHHQVCALKRSALSSARSAVAPALSHIGERREYSVLGLRREGLETLVETLEGKVALVDDIKVAVGVFFAGSHGPALFDLLESEEVEQPPGAALVHVLEPWDLLAEVYQLLHAVFVRLYQRIFERSTVQLCDDGSLLRGQRAVEHQLELLQVGALAHERTLVDDMALL